MDLLAVQAANQYTDTKVAELGTIGGGGLDENPNKINTIPTTPDLVTIDAANTTDEMSEFGSGAFVSVVAYTPSRDIIGTLKFGMGDAYTDSADGQFYIFDKDARVDNDHTVLLNTYPSRDNQEFFLHGGVTYYLTWIDWSATVGRTMDRGPILNRLHTYEQTGIVADDGMFIQHLHLDGTVNWVKFPAATGRGGSWAEGRLTDASGESSHAEGGSSQATGNYAHAEGGATIASGEASHAEGYGSYATGSASHAENASTASGANSHAENLGQALGDNSHAQGLAKATEDFEDAAGHSWAARSLLPRFSNSATASQDFFMPAPLDNSGTVGISEYRVTVAGFAAGAVVGLWEVQAVVVNDNGTLRLVGSPSITAKGDSGAASWTVTASLTTSPSPGLVLHASTNSETTAWWRALFVRDSFTQFG